jgi:thymidylate synthase (FAD)
MSKQKINLTPVGSGNVVLIAGGGKTYADVAARFCRTEKDLESIIGSEYDKKLLKSAIDKGHLSVAEFDYFVFGVEGYSRVCETQLVRKRHASYLIKSGRAEKKGKRSYDLVLPPSILDVKTEMTVNVEDGSTVKITVGVEELVKILSQWYDQGIKDGVPEEDLRYMKPQATEFKAIIGMNAHALMDFFYRRCCNCAQAEIRDLANKMLRLCKEAAPDLFESAGAPCRTLGYCPENNFQCQQFKGKVPTKNDLAGMISEWRKRSDEV